MRKSYLLFCLFLLAFSGKAFAQIAEADSLLKPSESLNAFYTEFGGNAMVGSFNYERKLNLPNSNAMLAFRLGGVFVPVIEILGAASTFEFLIPIEVSVLFGQKALKPEFGAGLTYYLSSGAHVIFQDRHEIESHSMVYSVLRVGLRYQIQKKPLFIRAGFTPLFFGEKATNTELPFMPYYGVSFGYNFRKKKN